MSEKTYPGYKSLFFSNLDSNQGKRIEQENYRNITNKVAFLYTKVSPRGCSQNTTIQFEDIDRAKNFIKIKEKNLKKYTENQLGKLNNPITKPYIKKVNKKKKIKELTPPVRKK
jgi:hypothetical protein